jgi:hypothetical protein
MAIRFKRQNLHLFAYALSLLLIVITGLSIGCQAADEFKVAPNPPHGVVRAYLTAGVPTLEMPIFIPTSKSDDKHIFLTALLKHKVIKR